MGKWCEVCWGGREGRNLPQCSSKGMSVSVQYKLGDFFNSSHYLAISRLWIIDEKTERDFQKTAVVDFPSRRDGKKR